MEEGYRTLKVRSDTYELLKRLKGSKPATRFLHELVDMYSRELESGAESVAKLLKRAEEAVEWLDVTVLGSRFSAREDGDVVTIDARITLRCGNEVVKRKLLEVLNSG